MLSSLFSTIFFSSVTVCRFTSRITYDGSLSSLIIAFRVEVDVLDCSKKDSVSVYDPQCYYHLVIHRYGIERDFSGIFRLFVCMSSPLFVTLHSNTCRLGVRKGIRL